MMEIIVMEIQMPRADALKSNVINKEEEKEYRIKERKNKKNKNKSVYH